MMQRFLTTIVLLGLSTCCFGAEPMTRLPRPHFHPSAADPAWLAQAVQFHGHLGPWAIAGLRAGLCARGAVKADGYFDVDVTVEGPFVKPPHSCFLDGLQVSTGATLGKRNLKWKKAEKIVVRLKNTRSGKVVEVRPTPALMKLVTSFKPSAKSDDHDHGLDHSPLETIARRIAVMPEKEILRVTHARR